ncbi:MAG TPA: adenylate/guanylate cyclase domain-containing protein [Actinomycetota bacterium]|nr:adenylate/guanylate cyclase domain-containing protein [Actinomycetota bacterium]
MDHLPTGTVTFLFTDVEGSTRLLQDLGEGYRAVQDDHFRLMRRALAQGDGVELRTEGDAFFVVFPSAVGAVRAAVAAQRALAAHRWPHGEPLRVRMGLHAGEGRLGGDDYLGIDVNRAARIAAAGHGGQVLVSGATRALAEADLPEGVSLRDLGEHRLKDLARPEHLHQLVIEGLPSEFPTLKTLDARPNNLPRQLTSFVGRADVIAGVVSLVRDASLVTLTGPGGTGKTRVALQAAAELLPGFADGAFFVDLSAVTAPAVVPSEVAVALGVAEDPGRPIARSVKEHLRDKELVLVLDNFEQVVEAAPAVLELIEAAPRLKVLVTSRSVLHLYGEREYPVPPLDVPDPERLPDLRSLSQYEAVALFIDRAVAVKPGFEVTNDNAPAVAEICARLDGLPLAIELAASRVKLLTPRAILDRLEHRLALLGGTAVNLPQRQRTLRGAIAWSYDLLEKPDRRFFARLSVFAGGATVEAVDAVCNPDGDTGVDTLDALASLVDKSLVRQTESPEGEPRFGMLETIKEFAGERLAEDFDTDDAAARHATFFLELAEEAEPNLTTGEQAPWLDRCEREHDNIRAVLRRSLEERDAETGLRIVAALWRFWQQRGHLREGLRWAEDVLALPSDRPTPARARAHSAAGGLAYWLSDTETTARHYEACASLARELGDRRILMEATYNLAFLPLQSDDPEEARPLFEEALAIARELDDPDWIVPVMGDLAFVDVAAGNYAEAISLLQETIKLARQRGQRFRLADDLTALGHAQALVGEFEAARRNLREGLEVLVEDENLPLMVTSLFFFAALAGLEGRHHRAARLWAAGQARRESMGGAPESIMRVSNPTPAAREAIGAEAVDRAVAEGRAMDLDKAVAYALEEAAEAPDP